MAGLRCRARLALLVLAAGLVGSVVAVPPADAGFPRTEDRIRNWAAENMGRDHTHTRAEAIRAAKRFDVIVATKYAYRYHVRAMKKANPDLVLLVYLNGTFAQKTQGSTFPEDWYSRDANGDKIRSKAYGNYLMDPSERGWVRSRIRTCVGFLRVSRYDGCFVDMLGTAPLEPGYLTGSPINPATGEPWTPRRWLWATGALGASVRSVVAPAPVVGNGLRSGSYYFSSSQPSRRLLRKLDGGAAESWMRTAWQSVDVWPTTSSWRRNVDMLVNAGARGKTVLTLTELWATATDAQRAQWHRFALGSFLLGDDGHSYFSFSGSRTADPTKAMALWRIELGTPRGDYFKRSGVFRRRFTRGKVVVNPTTDTYRVRLGGAYIDESGNRRRWVRLGPHEAEVLIEA
jgi:hypothetical protein